MAEEVRFFADLGLLLFAALAGGTLAHFLRLPLIVGYLIGGILVSPFIPGPTISDPNAFRMFADIGVILLMFSIGIEFSVGDLLRAGRTALLGAPVGLAIIVCLATAEAGSALAPLLRATLTAVLLLAPLLWLSRHLVPQLLDRIARAGDMELFLLVAVTIAIGTAALTAKLPAISRVGRVPGRPGHQRLRVRP